MRIQHNISAMNSYRNFSANNSNLSKNLEKLSTGYKINRAGDDAAGLAISEKMRAQITGLEGATKNAKDGISLIQTAEGALTEVHSMLNRMTTLAEQSANGTYDNELDRAQLQKEVEALKSEIDRVADSTNFNGLKLLDGSLSDKFETVTTKESAISNISTQDYAAKGKSDVFSVDEESIKVRGEASKTQTNTTFNVNLNAASFGSDVAANDILTLNIGGSDLKVKVVADDAANAGNAGTIKISDVTDASKLATAFANAGKKIDLTATATKANTNNAADGAETSSFKTEYDKAANKFAFEDSGADAHSVIAIDGHYYKMTAPTGTDTTIKFEQVDKMVSGTGTLKPDYAITMSGTDSTGNTARTVNQSPQDHVQVTATGKSVGSSNQAEVDLKLDFSKLKDGDKLTAGDRTYVFKIGENSQTKATPANGETLIDLSQIMKETADMADADKQAQAMVKIVGDAAAAGTNSAGPSNAWTMGNGGVTGGVGTLTFQSLDTYDENKTTGTVAAGAAAMIGTGKQYVPGTDDKTNVARMDSASNITKQFYTESKETNAKTSFDLDVSKIKVGDTFELDGKTFEFTDGADSTVTGGVAIDLSSMGVANGLMGSQRKEVFDKIKSVLDNTLQSTVNGSKAAKYDFTSSGDTITLESKDDTSTNSFENRVSAKLELPTETKHGEGLVLQIGDTADTYNKLTVSIEDMHSKALGIGDLDISNQEGAAAALDKIKAAINAVSDTRGNMGALQNRLDHTINNLGVMRENIQSAESMIRDTDVAEEMMTYTKNNILNQSAQAMLAQANQLPQGVLQLLG